MRVGGGERDLCPSTKTVRTVEEAEEQRECWWEGGKSCQSRKKKNIWLVVTGRGEREGSAKGVGTVE